LPVNLLLVPVGTTYRPALPISERPELAAAFARGEEMRASDDVGDEAHMEWLMGLSGDERTAYALGRSGRDRLHAPEPIAVAISLLLAEFVFETLRRKPLPWRDKVGAFVLLVAAVVVGSAASQRSQLRRAQALGLTPETAPLPAPIAIGLGQLLGRFVLVGAQQLRVRRRTGRWGRVSASSVLAAAALRELQRWRNWKAAYERGRRAASA
jgi:hypothetical protein